MSDIFMEIVQEKFDRKLKEEAETLTKKMLEKMLLTERISLIQKKCAKHKPLSVIADELETNAEDLRSIYNAVSENPEKNADEIYKLIAE